MLDSLKRKFEQLTGTGSRKSVAQIFNNPDYVQDSREQQARVQLYKLLMITAAADGSVDDAELDLLKDYLHGECVSEDEWKQIDYFRYNRPSPQEIDAIRDDVLNAIHTSEDRAEMIAAVKRVINADGILKPEEQALLELIEKKTPAPSFVSRIIGGVHAARVSLQPAGQDNAARFGKNPALAVLQPYLQSKSSDEAASLAAQAGLLLVISQSDMELSFTERAVLQQFLAHKAGLAENDARQAADSICAIPDNFFEIDYLTRIITDNTPMEQRLDLLNWLFKIARADGVFDEYEDKYLRIISNSLFISHADYIAAKLRK